MKPPTFWYSDNAKSLPALLLAPLSWLAAEISRRRWRNASPQHVGIPTLCIGNVTVGGAGKTPVALALAKHFLARNFNVHFLTRGYGGSESRVLRVDKRHDAARVGDEALELAAVAPCWVARDRLAGAKAASDAGAGMLILDDGLQNPRLHYDIGLLVVDGMRGLGNGRVLPAGPLREPWSDALARTDAVVVMSEPRQPHLRAALSQVDSSKLFTAHLHACPMALPPRLLTFSGIAYPEKLLGSLRELGGNVVGNIDFPDHHRFSESDARLLLKESKRLNAVPITTNKDAVRLAHSREASACGHLAKLMSVLRVEARFDDVERFESFAHSRMSK